MTHCRFLWPLLTGLAWALALPALAQDEPTFREADARRLHLKTVRVLVGDNEQGYAEKLRVVETYRFSPKGRLLSHRNPALEEAMDNTRSGREERHEEETDALGRVLVDQLYMDADLETTTYLTYDDRNRVVEKMSFSPPNELIKESVTCTTYGYDERGNNTETITAPTLMQGQWWLGYRETDSFDSLNRSIAHTNYNGLLNPASSDSTYYNAHGEVTRRARYYPQLTGQPRPQLDYLQMASYDAQHRLIEGTSLDNVGTDRPRITISTRSYRPDGQPLEETESAITFPSAVTVEALRRTLDTLRANPAGEQRRTTYAYNAWGQLTERRVTVAPFPKAYPQTTDLRRWQYEYYPATPSLKKSAHAPRHPGRR